MAAKEEIMAALATHRILLVCGETGSGKSTQIPRFLHEYLLSTQPKQIPRDENKSLSTNNASCLVAVTQPRRVAAISLAKRVAKEWGEQMGGPMIGYSVRFDERCSPQTRIRYMTDGMLVREWTAQHTNQQTDANNLSRFLKCRYAGVVLDEAHERSVRTDLLLGMARLLAFNTKGFPHFRLVIMSATLDYLDLLDFFTLNNKEGSGDECRVGVLKIPGRQFDVKILNTVSPLPDYVEAMATAIVQLHRTKPVNGKKNNHPSDSADKTTLDVDREDSSSTQDGGTGGGDGWDILAFLTGQDEIEAVKRILTQYAKAIGGPPMLLLPLHSGLSSSAQMAVFQKTPLSHRKIVLATNIAETSVTIPGIRFVIDCGFVKERRQISVKPTNQNQSFKIAKNSGNDEGILVESLVVVPCSQAAAQQRAGRAGREAAGGECYRLYPESAWESMPPRPEPEILRSALAPSVLTLMAAGIQDITSITSNQSAAECSNGRFRLPTPPKPAALQRALVDLSALGAIAINKDKRDEYNIGRFELSNMGRLMAQAPLTPPLARCLIEGYALGCLEGTLQLVSILSCLGEGSSLLGNSHLSFSKIQSNEDNEYQNDSNSSSFFMPFVHPSGDHLTFLSAYRAYLQASSTKTKDIREWCSKHGLDLQVLTRIGDICRQLRDYCKKNNMPTFGNDHPHGIIREGVVDNVGIPVAKREWVGEREASSMLRALTAGFFLQTAMSTPKISDKLQHSSSTSSSRDCSFITTNGSRLTVHIHPSSTLFSSTQSNNRGAKNDFSDSMSKCILYHELTVTKRQYARTVSWVDAAWVHQNAVKRPSQ